MEYQKLYNATHLKQLAKGQQKSFKKLTDRLKNMKNGDVDCQFHEMHESFFESINCLECANCCRTLGPRLTQKDIDQLSKYLGLKSTSFIEKYLLIDEDNDYVFKSMPCPFLGDDNYCAVYEYRPKACREYPHTYQNKIQTILGTCLKNTQTCPVVYLIFNELNKTT